MQNHQGANFEYLDFQGIHLGTLVNPGWFVVAFLRFRPVPVCIAFVEFSTN